MGFWLLVPGVGMGGSGAEAPVVVPNLCFTLENNRPEFTLPPSPEFTLEN